MKTFQEIKQLVDGIIGSSPEECFKLYEAVVLTKNLPGEIMEIGSLYGRTSCAIALGAKETGKKAVCVDYLFQYPDLETCKLGGYAKYPSPETIGDAFTKNTYLAFTRHLIERDLFDDVVIMASKSEQVATIWNKPLKFIFIDADHSYEGVKKDFELFEPYVLSGGLIGMHDIDPVGHPGVVKFYNEVMATGKYEVFWDGSGMSCRILRKK